MNKSTALMAIALVAVTGGAFRAQGAAMTSLADWCVNINGDINTACNGAGAGGTSPTGGSISLAGFDQTLSPGTNNLGSVVIALAPGANQFAAFYADYDLDFQAFGSFQDSASVHGALAAGASYESADPNVSNIFSDFAGDALPDVNSVGTASGPPAPCCDVSFALAVAGLTIAPGGSGSVTFTVSTTVPVSGFYIQQTDFDVGNSIYLSEVSTVINPTGPPGSTPEPSTFALGLGAMGFVLAAARRQRRRV